VKWRTSSMRRRAATSHKVGVTARYVLVVGSIVSFSSVREKGFCLYFRTMVVKYAVIKMSIFLES
jgi:hypothetical protein